MKLLFWKKKAQKERKSRVKNGKLKLLRGLYMISKTDPCKARTEYWMNEFNVSSRTIERWFFQLEQGGYLLRDRRIKNKRVPILTEKGLEMAVEMAVGHGVNGGRNGGRSAQNGGLISSLSTDPSYRKIKPQARAFAKTKKTPEQERSAREFQEYLDNYQWEAI